MTLSPLLLHSRQNPDDTYFTTFVRSATAAELSGTKIDSDGFPVNSVKFADKKNKLVWIDNPVITDSTQEMQTDIHQILSQNPDINGLSLILDDPAANHIQNVLQIEDFMPPSQYVDVFDVQEFVERSKRAFFMLPASLRKQFNNDPMLLASRLENKDPRALAAIQDFLGIDDVSQSSSKVLDVDGSGQANKDSVSSTPESGSKN